MFLWTVWFCNDEWACYVIAPTRGRAKSLFWDYWKWDGEYIDVRCYKVKPADGYEECVLDYQCETLESLGVSYLSEPELLELEV